MSRSIKPLPPDEVLFQRKHAPIRYEENDIYWADRALRLDQRLPNSDLLKSIHAFASEVMAEVPLSAWSDATGARKRKKSNMRRTSRPASRSNSPHPRLSSVARNLQGASVDTSVSESSQVPEDDSQRWRFMDETALLALGILLEETANSSLRQADDLSTTVAEHDGQQRGIKAWDGSRWISPVRSPKSGRGRPRLQRIDAFE